MKKLTALLLVLSFFTFSAVAQVTERCFHLDKVQFLQQKQDFWRSHMLFSTSATATSAFSGGFYNLTEVQYGFGLAEIGPPYANHYTGISTINGFRFGNGLALGIGVGYNKYNGGYTVPLYGDIRYFMGHDRVKFFAAVPGGFLVNFADIKDYSRIFGNPSLGLIVPLAKDLHLSFSAGLMTQYVISTGHRRDSFLNMKLGFLFGK